MPNSARTDATGHKKAVLYRMVMKEHTCPYGLKSKWLLERHGFDVEDKHLSRDAETQAFKDKNNVETTPQTFIAGKRIGGYESLRKKLQGGDKDPENTSYQPVVAIFAFCALITLALSYSSPGPVLTIRTIEWFAALSIGVLAIQKLQDVETFSTMFLNYDLLARRWVPYGYLYPFGEGIAATLMLAGGSFALAGAPLALFIGTAGAISVIKAVYVDKRELKCACVGGNSNVPLGFVSLTENLVMMAMGIWMPVKAFML